jgi:hypothetical protein
MAEQWHKWEEDVERLWGRWQVSLVLGLISTACAVWVAITVPSPGTAIALLGGVAALMSIRPAPMRPLEKGGWILILTVLLTTEIRSILIPSNSKPLANSNDNAKAFVASHHCHFTRHHEAWNGLSLNNDKIEHHQAFDTYTCDGLDEPVDIDLDDKQ